MTDGSVRDDARRHIEEQEELGLSPDAGGAARGNALVVGLSYLAAALTPLWPYAALQLMARPWSPV